MRLDHNRSQLLFALTVEATADPNSYFHLDAVHRKYRLNFDESLLDSLISRWEDLGLVDVSRTHDGTLQATIVRTRYADALQECARWLGASELTIDAKKEEILSDANPPEDIPLPNGWKWMTFETERFRDTNATPAYGQHQHLIPEVEGADKIAPKTDWSKVSALASWAKVVVGLLGIAATVLIALWVNGKL